jgi:hypothetical protein
MDKALSEKVVANLAAIGVSVDVKVSKGVVTLSGKIPKDKMSEVVRIAVEPPALKVINNLFEVTNNSDGSITYQGNGNEYSYSPFTSQQAKSDWEAIRRGELMEISLYGDFNRRIVISPDATEDEIFETFQYGRSNLTEDEKEGIREIDKLMQSKEDKINFTHNLTEADKVKIRAAVQVAKNNLKQNKISYAVQNDYQGGYNGEEKLSLSLLPDFLRRDDVTEWLFAYQIEGGEAYLYALDKFKQTSSDLWLMTAISKAETDSSGLKNLLESASRVSRSSLAYPTIAYHEARILIAQGKQAEARKLLDEVLNHSDNLPISSRNQFLEQRADLAQTMDDFLRDSLKTPFAFQSDGESETIDELIRQEKSYYDPKYYKESKEEYEREVEDRYKDAKAIENQRMFDDKAIEIINEHFPLAVLLDVEKSAVLPDYLKERVAKAIWIRAVLLKDERTANRIIAEIIRLNPDAETLYSAFLNAKTSAARQNAALYIILKNENLSPYVAAGLGSPSESYKQYASRWWCAPYNENSGAEGGEQTASKLSTKPKFLTAAQSLVAQTELKQLKAIGDAPKYLGRQVLNWAKRSPHDKRVPESLYIVYEANGWDKYGCGSNEELRNQIADVLKNRYPKSEWAGKLAEDTQ